ncbi:MAG: cell division protein FtsZ [Clostridia bacterium]|nr:cell division protein FtsZ [Clostridia bacterium]
MNANKTDKNAIRIKIIGVGGGGSNTVNRLITQNIPMTEYISANTNNGAVKKSNASIKLQIGRYSTKGHGAGANFEVGELAAEESRKEIEKAIQDCDILFITAGMGGGTGTGAAPIVAKIAKNLGILTVAVVTLPFSFEGNKRMKNALSGITKLENCVDSLIVIPNENIKKFSWTKITLDNAFSTVDDVLAQVIKNIVEVIQQSAYINCDFADVSSIIKASGYMHTVTAKASGIDRVNKIVTCLKTNNLLNSSVENATGILLYITISQDISLAEIDEISTALSDAADLNVNFIFGVNINEAQDADIKAVLIATHAAK